MAKRNLTRLSTVDLQAEIERRQRQLPALMDQRKRLIAELSRVESQIEALGAGGVGRRRRAGRPVRVGRRARNKVALGDMLVGILKRDEPMKVSDIVDQVVARGYQTTSANFSTIVNQTLIKDERFKQASRGHYLLA